MSWEERGEKGGMEEGRGKDARGLHYPYQSTHKLVLPQYRPAPARRPAAHRQGHRGAAGQASARRLE